MNTKKLTSGLSALALLVFMSAMMPGVSAEPVDHCVDGDEICVCVSDLSAGCSDANSSQDDCIASVGTDDSNPRGLMCEMSIVWDTTGPDGDDSPTLNDETS